ncbi:MAG: methyltransferase domain-containing protein [Chloroflexi bacterium]|nr:methyltransferase domain-containing protein [Chloroflexota bacterium]
MARYVHGYSSRETQRLDDQAAGLQLLLHWDTEYPARAHVLEAGCGTGAQTIILAARSPCAHFTAIDISLRSLRIAARRLAAAGRCNVRFQRANIMRLPFEPASFDHVFVSFVLEHLARPAEALESLKRVLKVGGTITVIEGDHGSCYFHPETPAALQVWRALIEVQARLGGNSLIGRQVFPLLRDTGFRDVRVTPRVVYAGASRPAQVEGFVRRIIIPMVQGVEQRALVWDIVDEATWGQGLCDLAQTASPGGTFSYTFFKGTGVK